MEFFKNVINRNFSGYSKTRGCWEETAGYCHYTEVTYTWVFKEFYYEITSSNKKQNLQIHRIDY